MIGEAVRTGRPVRQAVDALDSSLKISTGFLVHSLLYVPILSRGRPLGVLAVDNRGSRRPFSARDEAMLTSLVDYAAVALENASLYEKARREIAERKRVEAALRESEERYALAALGANDGIWDWALRTTVSTIRHAGRACSGSKISRSAQTRRNGWAGCTRRISPGCSRPSATICTGITHLAYEYRILNKAGEYMWMLCRGIAVRGMDGSAGRIAGSQTDITRQHGNRDPPAP